MTPTGHWRFTILRIYWDGETTPSVEVPVGDFFACGWGQYAQISSLAVCVNPGSAFNCYWEMPFRKSMPDHGGEYRRRGDDPVLSGELHADGYPRRRGILPCAIPPGESPARTRTSTRILDGVKGWGHYVGTYMAWEVNNTGWWGEGEIKFYLDGDTEYPDHLRHGHRGLLLRFVQLREPEDETVPGIFHALFRTRAGHSAGRCVQVTTAVRALPVAHHRSGAFREGSPGNHSGAGVEIGRTVPAVTGRYRFGGVLVSDGTPCTVPEAARTRTIWK